MQYSRRRSAERDRKHHPGWECDKVTIQKPKQKKPNSYSRKFWKKAIQSFTTDGKKVNTKLGSWMKDRSRSGKWKSYRAKDNKVYDRRDNKEEDENDDHQYWDVYEQRGCQLNLIDEVDLEEFKPNNGTPIQIKSLANGMIYEEMTAVVVQDKTKKKTYGPDVS
jgi:hypothetical protein